MLLRHTILSSLPSTTHNGEIAMIQDSECPYQIALQGDGFYGVRISDLLILLLDVMVVNEPYLLSYLLLRVIKAKALSLSIIPWGWFNFKCQENRYTSRKKKKKGKKEKYIM